MLQAVSTPQSSMTSPWNDIDYADLSDEAEAEKYRGESLAYDVADLDNNDDEYGASERDDGGTAFSNQRR